MSLSTQYDFITLQQKWYSRWLAHDLFTATHTAEADPYTIVMPPPNVTGILHLGHVLNNVIQDTLVRRASMQGKQVCWVPGLDHAAIATEAKVVEMLKEKGIDKHTLSREAFLRHAWAWKEKYGSIIFDQLKQLGIACDWKHARFTLDSSIKESVQKAFITLYEKGYIYRDERMIHWDPKGQTALADEEVIYREREGRLYYIRYRLVTEGEIVIATTRPETLLGDTAICVHPEDPRYLQLHGKYALLPLLGRKIPIIADAYVDRTMGTGALKVTPAHDANDYAIGKRHKLPLIDIFSADGRLNADAKRYVGEDRAVARKKIVKDLEKEGYLVKTLPHKHQVGFSERTQAIVEPRLSTQWFVKMSDLALPALEAVQKGTIRFHPAKFQNLYTHWMKNIRDWCVSRQLWWGHRIPAYYLKDGRFVIAASAEEALEKARILARDFSLQAEDLTQDSDVLDTWFSAWLWPMVVFDGINDPHAPAFTYRYPTDDLVTAPDIIFFWVARMIMAGYAFTGKPPFKNVYFTGLVRDKRGRKMSKSLGNSPDPLVLIKKYGADGVRAGMLFCSPAGNDLLFDEKLCGQGARFAHKIWNALRLVKGWTPDNQAPHKGLQKALQWFSHRYNQIVSQVNQHFVQFRISEALMLIYKLIWEDFCSHYLEMIKPDKDKHLPAPIHKATHEFFSKLMLLLHPFMPFITEEVWHQLDPDREDSFIAREPWPTEAAFDSDVLAEATDAFALVNRIRHLKINHTWEKDHGLTLLVEGPIPSWVSSFEDYIKKATAITSISSSIAAQHVATCMIGKHTFFIPELQQQEADSSRASLEKEYESVHKILMKTGQKLASEKFLQRAPKEIVAYTQQQYHEAKKRAEALQLLLSQK